MRIGIFTDTFLPKIDGIVTSTVALAKGLADKGHKVYIFAPRIKKEKEFKYKNVKVKRLPSMPAFFYEDFKFTSPMNPRLISYVIKEKIDILHLQTPFTMGSNAIMLSQVLQKPLVGTFHTFIADPEYLKHIRVNNKLMQKIAWSYTNLYYNKCHMITCPSNKTKEEIINNGCKREVVVISNGIDGSAFDSSNKDEVKKKYGLVKGKSLLYVGRIAHEKSIDILIASVRIVIEKDPDVKFLIVGDGPQKEMIEKIIQDDGLENNIFLLGRIPHDVLVKSSIINACDIFITASKTETQSITVLEAQVNGLVPIGVDAKALPEVIVHDVGGIVVEPDNKEQFVDAIMKLIDDKEYYKRLQKGALEVVKRHDMNNVLDTWENLYKETIIEYEKNKEKSYTHKIYGKLKKGIDNIVSIGRKKVKKSDKFTVLKEKTAHIKKGNTKKKNLASDKIKKKSVFRDRINKRIVK